MEINGTNQSISEILENDLKKKSEGFISKTKAAIGSIMPASLKPKTSTLDAETAYLKAVYGKYTSTEEIISELIQSIDERIKSRVEQGALHTLVEVNPEIIDYAGQIAKIYKDKGFQVWPLDKAALAAIDPAIPVNKTTMFLLIMWDKVFSK